MTIADGLVILAVLVAPVAAVQIQKFLEKKREKRLRRLAIFQALMATRAARVSPRHVEALNMIELEFYGDEEIVGAWRIYRDHLNRTDIDRDDTAIVQSWLDRGDDLFVELLHAIARRLGYRFDRVDLRRGAYTPVAQGEAELLVRFARQAVYEVLQGTRPIPVQVIPISQDEAEAKS